MPEWSSLSEQRFTLSRSGERHLQPGPWLGHASLESLGENLPFPLAAILAVPWLVNAALQALPHTSHDLLPGYVSADLQPLLIRTPDVLDLGPTLSNMTSSHLFITTNISFPNKVKLTAPIIGGLFAHSSVQHSA